MFSMPFPESQGQNLALTVLYVPYSLDSGTQAITPTPGSVLSSFEDLQLSGRKVDCRTNERAGDSLEQAFADSVNAQRVKQLAPQKGNSLSIQQLSPWEQATRCNSQVSFVRIFERLVTKLEPTKPLHSLRDAC